MFQFSFATVYMTVLTSNILLILLTFCFRNKKIMINAGYRLLSVFAVLTLVRFLLPFELPFTRTIILPEFISKGIFWVRHPLFHIWSFEINYWNILLLIWFIGIVIKLILHIRRQSVARYSILANRLDVTAEKRYQSILENICHRMNRRNCFRIFEVDGLNTPHLYGIFSPCILLPAHFNPSEENLYYTFLHEASHHFHHDLLTKQIVNLLDIIYWWNPFCRILIKQTDIILEMRIDDLVTEANSAEIKNYLHCLIDMAEAGMQSTNIPDMVSISLLPDDEDVLTKRFEMLIASSQKKNRILNLLLLLLVLGIHFSSYAFIIEGSYHTEEVQETSFSVSADNTYAILKEDGTYDVYGFGLLLENTDSLDYYGPDIPIYTEKEYENEKK